MSITRAILEHGLTALLPGPSTGNTADLRDCMVAYWNSISLVYAYFGAGKVEEEQRESLPPLIRADTFPPGK